MQVQQSRQGNYNFLQLKRNSNLLQLPLSRQHAKSVKCNYASSCNSSRIRSPRQSEFRKSGLFQSRVDKYKIVLERPEKFYLESITDRTTLQQPQTQNFLVKDQQADIQTILISKKDRSKSNSNCFNILNPLPKRLSQQMNLKSMEEAENFRMEQKYGLQKVHRRGMIQKTKKAVEQFNKNNLQLLDNIKKFRNQFSRRASPHRSLKRTPTRSPAKQNTNHTFSTNYSETSSIILNVDKIQQAFKDYKDYNDLVLEDETQKTVNDDNFFVLKKLGTGTFATAYLAVDKRTGFLVTLKKIKKKILKNKKCQDQLITQIKIQMFADNPNVLKIYGFYVDDQTVTLILQFMEEGNLYQKIKTKKPLSEKEVSQSVCEILFALKYLHDNKIVHRDIKPQNVVLSHKVRKLCDFGTAAICADRRSTVCGTLDYSAPQLIEGHQYNAALDIWSLGVMTFELLTGKPPFYHVRRKDTIKEIVQYQDGQIQYPRHLSLESINFMGKFLLKNPQKRISIDAASRHKFIEMYADHQTKELRQKYMKRS